LEWIPCPYWFGMKTIFSEMKAYAQRTKGGPEVLEIIEFPKPIPTGHDLLVKVFATATNPVDGKIRSGSGPSNAPLDPPKILGWDAAGVVEAVGELVTTYKTGEEVYFAGDVTRQGANAEYTLVDERITGRKPKTLTWEQAASVPLCALTAWEPLVESAGLAVPAEGGPNPNADKTLLVVGGAGGVGSAVIQLAKKVLKIGKVIATASRPETIEWVKRLGADVVINHNNLKTELANVGITSVHYAYVTPNLNTVFNAVLEVVRPTGAIIGITGWGGVDTSLIVTKRVTLIPELMFSRAMHNVEMEKQAEILNKYSAWLDAGVLVHTQNHHFEWHQIREAQQLQDSGKAIGKITLTVKF